MWPRACELVIGVWLIASTFVLPHDSMTSPWRINDWVCGTSIIVLAGLCFWPKLYRAHLVEILIALWMLGFAFVNSSHPAPPAPQSDVLAALFLLNFAIIPTRASVPPRSWRNFRDVTQTTRA